jgi:hypothetical protein
MNAQLSKKCEKSEDKKNKIWTLLYIQQERNPNKQNHKVSVILPEHYFVFHLVQLPEHSKHLTIISIVNISNINKSQ